MCACILASVVEGRVGITHLPTLEGGILHHHLIYYGSINSISSQMQSLRFGVRKTRPRHSSGTKDSSDLNSKLFYPRTSWPVDPRKKWWQCWPSPSLHYSRGHHFPSCLGFLYLKWSRMADLRWLNTDRLIHAINQGQMLAWIDSLSTNFLQYAIWDHPWCRHPSQLCWKWEGLRVSARFISWNMKTKVLSVLICKGFVNCRVVMKSSRVEELNSSGSVVSGLCCADQ